MPGVSKIKRLVLSRLFLARTPTTFPHDERVRVYWKVLQIYLVALSPSLDLGLVDDRFCAAFLLMLEDVHGLQCRNDVFRDNVGLFPKVEDRKSFLRGTRDDCTG
jgi:hypothetical protein